MGILDRLSHTPKRPWLQIRPLKINPHTTRSMPRLSRGQWRKTYLLDAHGESSRLSL